mmetsp:Transcript_26432/g.55826  ORF Transcript_26432/g.55826 Transcript_26432/m.55826 type:complete len:376 (-) Transcript_26432:1606-2733(-)
MLRRRLIVCALSVLLAYYSCIHFEFQFNTTNATSPAANVTVVSYNDTRPIAPNGYLCVFGAKGRLNNKILHNLVGIYMAHYLNRTFLVDPEVSQYYDIDRLSLTVYADSPYRAAMPIEKSDHPTCGNPNQISPYTLTHGLSILERFDEYQSKTKDRTLASVDNNDAWYWLGRPPEEIYGRFFQGLIPRQVYLDKVHAFLEEHNLHQTLFNSLHLRYFEGKCGNFNTDLCCPKLEYVQWILIERDGSMMDPLFVANDGQCPQDVLATYTNATDNEIIMGYNGPCEGTECAVLDFELCIHANVFVGNMKSSGDWNIREWRLARYNTPGWKSVLSREEETLALERRTEYMTRYIIGHWRIQPDCDNVGVRQRNQRPCA